MKHVYIIRPEKMHNIIGVLVIPSRLHSFCLIVMQLFSSERFEDYMK